MALRNIRTEGDPVLGKQSKPVTEMTARLATLIEDMLDTMYDAGGVGLAAPQVGVLKRVVVIDVSEGEEPQPIILINPEITDTDGSQTGYEGCLSVPGKSGIVTRPAFVRVTALNEAMEPVTVEGEGLLARALCHEIEHLDGHLYVEKVEGRLLDNEELQQTEE